MNDTTNASMSETVTESGCGRRINILFIINDLKIGGAEKMMLYLISGLDRRIYNPIVCTLIDRGEYRNYLKTYNIEYHTLNMTGYHKTPFALIKLIKIIKRHEIVIIHSYLFYSDLMARAAGFLARVPVVITSMRNIDLWRKPWHIFIDSLTFGLSSAIISNSLAGASRLSNIEKIPADRIKVVYNAIKLDEYAQSASYSKKEFKKSIGADENDLIIVTVARLEEQKDHFSLLRAAKLTLDKLKKRTAQKNSTEKTRKIKFILAGGGALIEDLKKAAKKLEIADSVIFLGTRTDIKEILHSADIFLLTSIYEGIPNAILEAQSCMVPVIATDVGGVSEIITDNHNGILCNPRDIETISEKIIHLIANPRFAENIAHNAFQRLKSKFSCESLISKTCAIYKNLLIQHSPHTAADFFDAEEFRVKLNILYVITSSDTGGAQKHLLSLVKHFVSGNHQLKVACAPGEPLVSELKKIGVMPHILKNLQKSINPIKDIFTFYDICKLLIENNFHIIHCHSTKAGILGRLAAFFAGVPVKIFTAHGFVFHDSMNPVKKYLCVLAEKIGAVFSDAIITVSRADYLKARKYKIIDEKKIKLIPNGINPEAYEQFSNLTDESRKALRARYGFCEKDLLIGSVGRLVYEKSYSTAITAFAALLKTFPDAVLVIAGEGYERRALEILAQKLGIENRIKLIGAIESPEEIYSIIDIFFLSSIKEGMPYSLLEAACFALPCVCSDAGGIGEIIRSDKTGILCRSGSAGEFHDALSKMISLSSRERRSLGTTLKFKVTAEYAEKRMLENTEHCYIELAARKGLF